MFCVVEECPAAITVEAQKGETASLGKNWQSQLIKKTITNCSRKARPRDWTLILKFEKKEEMFWKYVLCIEKRIFYGRKEEVQKIQHTTTINFSANTFRAFMRLLPPCKQVYSTYVIQCDVVFIHALAPVNFRWVLLRGLAFHIGHFWPCHFPYCQNFPNFWQKSTQILLFFLRKGLPVVFVEIFFWYWEVLSFKSLYIYWSSFDPGWEF